MSPRPVVGVYRRLLLLYPASFRRRFSDAMVDAFAEDLERRTTVVSKTLLVAIATWHVVTGAIIEHIAGRAFRTGRRVGIAGRRHGGPFWTQGVIQDIRHAGRALRTDPGLSLVVVATLALGVGASTAIFSVVNTLVLRPLPFEDAEQLLRLRDTVDRPGEATWWYNSSARSFVFVRDHATLFRSVTGGDYRQFNVTGGDEPVTVVGSAVSDGWLETLGVMPVVGRDFTVEEQASGDAASGALIGHGLWGRWFGRDPDLEGKTLTLDGRTYDVIGVLPPGFNFPYGAEVWVMGTFDPTQTGGGPHVIARLAAGVSGADAARELEVLSRSARAAYPESHRSIRFTAVGMREDLVGNRSDLGLALLGAVVVLILIACGNVANLLLIRSTARRRDLALRNALGATPWRQVRRLVIETGVLAALGWTVGLVLAVWLTDGMAALSVPPGDGLGEFFTDIRVDHRVLLFSIAVTGIALGLTALLPAVRAARADVRDAIADGQPLGSRRVQPWMRAVVVTEVALAFVLLIGTTAVLDDLRRLERTALGFEPDGRLVVPLAMSGHRYPDPEDRIRFLHTIEARIRAVPGVQAVGLTQHTPVSNGDWTGAMTIEGGHESTADNMLLANFRAVTPAYPDALGARFVAGRSFTVEENTEERNVVIVTHSMAARHWPGETAVGRRVKFGPLDNDNPWLTVVGVVRDVKEEWNGVDDTWYVPYRQSPQSGMEMVVWHDGPPAAVTHAVRAAVTAVDPEQPVGDMQSLRALVDRSFSPERFGATLAGAFAGFGLLLAALGVYGVLAFAVRQRVRELGLRMALGASARRVVRTVLASGLTLGGAGFGIGLIVSRLAASWPRVEWADGDVNQFRLLADGISLDWSAVGLTVLVLAAVTLVASYLPARRATRVSPAVALRDG